MRRGAIWMAHLLLEDLNASRAGEQRKDMRMRAEAGRTTLVAVAMAAALSGACEKPAAVAPPPPEVYVADVIQQDVPVYLELVGQTQGFQDVDIRARVEGFLETVDFREGSFVRQGECSTRSTGSRSRRSSPPPGPIGQRRGPIPEGQQRRGPLHAPGGQAGREPAGTGQRPCLAGREGTRAEVEAAKAAVEKARLDLGYERDGAHRRTGRDDARQAGQPRGRARARC